MNKRIEILAPAGSYEGMRAAMNAGCDAVYIGGSSFGARAYANNLDEETLLRAIDEAHLKGKQLYLTVNTLLKEKELTEELFHFLENFYLQGLDAVIVQDVGVMHYIHRHFPLLPIHASTQTTIMMAEGAELLKSVGVTRIVTARELSLKEIKVLREKTDLEIETFVHGALCYCYSGQCLMSSMIGGRSGNRGRCAQPCRMPYELHSNGKQIANREEKYLLSPKDISTVAIIPELIEAGINSFKIEGRMKRPEYAAFVSHIYRKYTDLYLSEGKEKFKEYVKGSDYNEDIRKLQDIYNRGGFTEGYFHTHHDKKMISLVRPNHSGVPVGEITLARGSKIHIKLKESVNAQDVLEIRGRGETSYEFTIKNALKAGELLVTTLGRVSEHKGIKDNSKVGKGYTPAKFSIGDNVYRTRNNLLLTQIATDFMTKETRLIVAGSLSARTDKKLSLSLSYQDITVTAYHNPPQAAIRQPMTLEKITEQISKTGDTSFILSPLMIDMEEDIFVPVAWLNELRRDALQLLQKKITSKYHRAQPYEENQKSSNACCLFEQSKGRINNDFEQSLERSDKQVGVCVSVLTREQFELALDYHEVDAIYTEYNVFSAKELIIYGNKTKNKGKQLILSLPHIIRPTVYDRLKKDIIYLLDYNVIDGYLVKNFEEAALLISLIKEGRIKSEQVILNHNMYIFNQEAKLFWKENKIAHFTAPLELNSKELKALRIYDCDMMVYGHIPLMVTAQCLYEGSMGCRKGTEREFKDNYLLDRMKKRFFIRSNCDACYNTIYNGQRLSLLSYAKEALSFSPISIRLDFTIESADEMKLILQLFTEAYLQDIKANNEIKDFTTGHFKRGVE